MNQWKSILSNPKIYRYARHIVTGGLPFSEWVRLYGLDNPAERIGDLGCGPADILCYLSASRRPAFYLGIDISQEYLDAAKSRIDSVGIDGAMIRMDLTQLPDDPAVQEALVGLLEQYGITRVLLLGVLHHIDDASVVQTLNLVARVPTVRTLVTQDVIRIPGAWLNNKYCDLDRGEYIRQEAGYDALIARTDWPGSRKFWTKPGLPLRYIHYELSK